MASRREKGLFLARSKGIKQISAGCWVVPSSTGAGAYAVNVTARTCTCPDFETRRKPCKHLLAVELLLSGAVVENAVESDGITASTETTREARVTYKQDWPNYNAAQVHEKDTVQSLLRSLCDFVPTPPHPGRGPKPIRRADAVYGMVAKVYSTQSGRRASTDIRECAKKGHLTMAPGYNTLFEYFEKPEMTPLLTALVEESARPLSALETSIAVDSTGFGVSTYRRWYDTKYRKNMQEQGWVKGHMAVATVTNVVTAIIVTDWRGADSPQFPALIRRTAENFNILEVSADKAYLSHANVRVVSNIGAAPYIPFKLNSNSAGARDWRRMWGLFTYRQEEFLAKYHKRSNIEATFAAIKAKFGGAVRSRLFVAQVNEVLCKVIAYNLSCLAHAILEFGIEPHFRRAELPS